MAFPIEHEPTNPNALPDYDGLGWDSQWSAADWMTWHAALVGKFGIDEANTRFITAWQGGSFFESAPLDARTFNSAFREFARKNGILDALYFGLGAIAKPLGAANDVLDTVTAIGGGVKDAGKSLGGSLKWWLLGAAVLGLAFYILPAAIARAGKKAFVK
jgi:hypothetical protein